MHKHVIYISNNQYQDLLSSYLAHAFAKYRYDNGKTTFLVQKGLNNNPLLIINDLDTLQIFLTDINVNSINLLKLNETIDTLIKSLITDGFNSQKCTIKIYTLEPEVIENVNLNQNQTNLEKDKKDMAAIFAAEIMKYFPYAEYSIEWHTIKKSPQNESTNSKKIVENIFNSSITFNKMILTGANQNHDGLKYTNIKNYYPDYDLEKMH